MRSTARRRLRRTRPGHARRFREASLPRSGRRTISPTLGAGRYSSGTWAPRAQAAAVSGVTAKPFSAALIASERQRSRPSFPYRSASAAQPPTAPGTVTESEPWVVTSVCGHVLGAAPAESRPSACPSDHTIAKLSPPMPLPVGSVTASTAAAASAASAAFPPCSSARSPARVASGWLVATIAVRGDRGRAAEPEAVAHVVSVTSAAAPTMRAKRGTTSRTLSLRAPGDVVRRGRSRGGCVALWDAARPASCEPKRLREPHRGGRRSRPDRRRARPRSGPAQYASSSASSPWTPAQSTATSDDLRCRPPRRRQRRLSSEPTSTTSQREAAASEQARAVRRRQDDACPAAGSRNSRGELPKSKPSIRTVLAHPPSTASPSAACRGPRLLHLRAAEDARVAGAKRLRDRRRRPQDVDDDADRCGDLLGRREGDVCAHEPPVR